MQLKTDLVVFLILLVLSACHMAYYYPLMPDTVASHFDFHGNPDGWSSKETFLLIYAGVMALLAVCFLSVRFLLHRTPDSWFSLPNKAFWLSPERRAETISFIAEHLNWFGCAAAGFVIACMHLIIQASLGAGGDLGVSLGVVLGLYLLAAAVVLVRFLLRFLGAPERRSGRRL